MFHLSLSVTSNLVFGYGTSHFKVGYPQFLSLLPLLTSYFRHSFTDYFFFLVLDIGNTAFDSIPVGVRFAIGALQATAVRAAGFATVPLSQLAPAVQ